MRGGAPRPGSPALAGHGAGSLLSQGCMEWSRSFPGQAGVHLGAQGHGPLCLSRGHVPDSPGPGTMPEKATETCKAHVTGANGLVLSWATEDQATCAAGSHTAGAPSGVIHLTIEEQRARVTGKGGDGCGVGAPSTEAQQASWDNRHGAATRSRGGAPMEPRGGEPAARRRLTSSHAGFSETFRMRARQGARSRPVPSLERRGCTAEVALKQQGAPPAPRGPAPWARALGTAAAGALAVHGPLTDTPRLAGDTSSRPVGQGPGCGPVVLGRHWPDSVPHGCGSQASLAPGLTGQPHWEGSRGPRAVPRPARDPLTVPHPH